MFKKLPNYYRKRIWLISVKRKENLIPGRFQRKHFCNFHQKKRLVLRNKIRRRECLSEIFVCVVVSVVIIFTH